MKIQRTARFKKQLRKLSPKLQQQFENRLVMLLANPRHPQLRLHTLRGKKYKNCWSINVTGDVRAIFQIKDNWTLILLLKIGSHSQLY